MKPGEGGGGSEALEAEEGPFEDGVGNAWQQAEAAEEEEGTLPAPLALFPALVSAVEATIVVACSRNVGTI